jgi:arylformamidase
MKIYDITIPVSADVPIYKGDPTVQFELCKSIANGDAANVSQICMGVHTATHVDAPNHFIDGAKRVHELALDSLVGKCRVIEISNQAEAVLPEHLGNLEGVERVLFKTKNSEFWNTPEDGFRTDFAWISPSAAKALADAGCVLVGLDYLSVEKFGSEDFATHLTLLGAGIVILEGADLREVPAGDYEIVCLPLKYIGGGGDGSPARTILIKR